MINTWYSVKYSYKIGNEYLINNFIAELHFNIKLLYDWYMIDTWYSYKIGYECPINNFIAEPYLFVRTNMSYIFVN